MCIATGHRAQDTTIYIYIYIYVYVYVYVYVDIYSYVYVYIYIYRIVAQWSRRLHALHPGVTDNLGTLSLPTAKSVPLDTA